MSPWGSNVWSLLRSSISRAKEPQNLPNQRVVKVIVVYSTMGFITIFHHHLGGYVWVTFSIRSEQANVRASCLEALTNQPTLPDIPPQKYKNKGLIRPC